MKGVAVLPEPWEAPVESDPYWRPDAACRDEDPDLFFPAAGNSAAVKAQEERARAVCRRCPVRRACLGWAVATRQEHGVWGGLATAERDALPREGPVPSGTP